MTLLFSQRKQIKIEEEWPNTLRRQLIAKNKLYLKSIPPKQHYTHQRQLWQSLSSQQPLTEKHNYDISYHSHSHYSEYIPITSNQYITNQIDQCLPYLKVLSQKYPNQYEDELSNILARITSNKTLQQWRQICQEYAPRLQLPQLIGYFLELLALGTKNIAVVASILKCKEKPFLQSLLEVRSFFALERQKQCKILSTQRNDKLSLETMSKTSKYMFCSICLIYDCSRHPISSIASRYNYQYLPSSSVEGKTKRLTTDAISLFVQLYTIYSGAADSQHLQACSQTCYRHLDSSSFKKLSTSSKLSSFSPIAMTKIRMGVQIYSFNPCQICHLFTKQQSLSKCEVVFLCLLKHYAITSKLEHKFHLNEHIHLMNQNTNQREIYVKKNCRKKKQNKKLRKQEKEGSSEGCNSVCFHYFLNGEREDVNCSDCHCRKRGYCLPECQCSSQCTIPLLGCKCRGVTGKCLSNCPCYQAKRTCTPGLCLHCFSDQDCNSRCFNNEYAYSRKKLTRVGGSTIQGAGLGLFAGEDIPKDAFIIKYTGEIVESSCLQKLREDLSKDSMFYAFTLNCDESLDSRLFGNKARFMNHSQSKENVRAEVLKIQQEDTLIFRALRQIRKDEQLLFNYNGAGQLSDFKEKYPFIQ